jgi:hypothetical protein
MSEAKRNTTADGRDGTPGRGRVPYAEAGRAARYLLARAGTEDLTRRERKVLDAVVAMTATYSRIQAEVPSEAVCRFLGWDVTSKSNRRNVGQALASLAQRDLIGYQPGKSRGVVSVVTLPAPPEGWTDPTVPEKGSHEKGSQGPGTEGVPEARTRRGPRGQDPLREGYEENYEKNPTTITSDAASRRSDTAPKPGDPSTWNHDIDGNPMEPYVPPTVDPDDEERLVAEGVPRRYVEDTRVEDVDALIGWWRGHGGGEVTDDAIATALQVQPWEPAYLRRYALAWRGVYVGPLPAHPIPAEVAR